jgi:hypothetical protein
VNHCFLCSRRRRRRKLHCTVRHRYKTMPRPHASHVSAHHGAFLRIPSQGSTATENNGTMGIIWESHLLSVTHVPQHCRNPIFRNFECVPRGPRVPTWPLHVPCTCEHAARVSVRRTVSTLIVQAPCG